MSESLQEIITNLWVTPERAEWTPKTDVVALSDVRRWMASGEIEILGFTLALLSDRRFRVAPPISLNEYIEFIKGYSARTPARESGRRVVGFQILGRYGFGEHFCEPLERLVSSPTSIDRFKGVARATLQRG